jgi:hypothetical protein
MDSACVGHIVIVSITADDTTGFSPYLSISIIDRSCAELPPMFVGFVSVESGTLVRQ